MGNLVYFCLKFGSKFFVLLFSKLSTQHGEVERKDEKK
jgi:hypothetical protein